jgi:hypothetical protein
LNTESNNGLWQFRATDMAGNTSEISNITLSVITTFQNKAAIRDSYKVNSWYRVILPARVFNVSGKNIAGSYTFRTYESALKFALTKEEEYRVGVIPSGWTYVSAGNESVTQIYTDREVLDTVLYKYASAYVQGRSIMNNGSNNYYTSVNENGEIDEQALTAQTLKKPDYLNPSLPLYFCSKNFAFVRLRLPYSISMQVTLRMVGTDISQVSGQPIVIPYDEKIASIIGTDANNLQGYYLVTETDAAGFVEAYYIYLDFEAPFLMANALLGNGTDKNIVFYETYLSLYAGTLYYIELNLNSIGDNIDDFVVISIKGRGLTDISFVAGEELPILDGVTYYGRYTIVLYDRSGNTLTFEVVIAGAAPYMQTSSLTSETECRLQLVVPDSLNSIVSLQLLRISYDGAYMDILFDDRGTSVNFLTLTYYISQGGRYTMRYTDLFGRSVELPSIFYMKGLPSGVLSGVKDGGITNKTVTFRYANTYSFIAYKIIEGARVPFVDFTTEFNSQNNSHTITLIANETSSAVYVFFLYNTSEISLYVEYSFEIDCILPSFFVLTNSGEDIAVDTASTKPFKIIWTSGLTVRYYTSNTAGGSLNTIRYTAGTLLVNDATYYFNVIDSVGNTLDFVILLKTRVNYKIEGDYITAAPNSLISKNNLKFTVLDTMTQFIVSNADGYTIENGGTLIFEGIYLITVIGNYATVWN